MKYSKYIYLEFLNVYDLVFESKNRFNNLMNILKYKNS